MDKETILKAVVHCLDKTTSCIGCPLVNKGDVCGVYLTEYISSKENEPAPAPTETSPQNNNLHFDDSTFKSICQAFDSVGRAVNTILDTYNAMSESEQRAFDLGESYRDMLSAKRELDEIKGGDAS